MLDHQSHFLATGRHLYQLSRVAGHRVPTWEALILTASSAAQAALYRQQLDGLVRGGRLPVCMRTLVVEDPEGVRIGSGGATLAALRQAQAEGIDLKGKVLLIHAGGDSKRLPWASVPGKVFVPFPLHAHPDHPVPTLAEQLLAAVAAVPGQVEGSCLLVASGDVLPLFPAITVESDPNGITLVVASAPLDVAGRHGAAAVDADGRIRDLLQKASPTQLATAGAVLPDGSAWIDTGLVMFRGAACLQLSQLACAHPDPVKTLVSHKQEISLYEEILSAAVPSRHAWLRTRPLGEAIYQACNNLKLLAWRCPDFGFVHLGTNTEFLAHCQHGWKGCFTRRLLAEHGPLVQPDATILASQFDPAVHVGSGSVVISSRLGSRTRIGNRCVVFQVLSGDLPLQVPDNTCIWQVALRSGGWATLCCGTDDNPKDVGAGASFLGMPLGPWMQSHGIDSQELWDGAQVQDLWTAKIFPVGEAGTALPVLRWLIAPVGGERDGDAHLLALWRSLPRTSMAQTAAGFDPGANLERAQAVHRALVVRRLAGAVETCADIQVGPIAATLDQADLPLLIDLADRVPLDASHHVARSRRLRLRSDLLHAAGDRKLGEHYAARAWEAVSDEVVLAQSEGLSASVSGLVPGQTGACDLPGRFDLAGGWSDTPPYCLERPARVLNMAIELDGKRPIGARAQAQVEPVWELHIDGLEPVRVNAQTAKPLGGLADPYALVKIACSVMGFGSEIGISQGIRLHTWSQVPKGSGLGSSSILAAAICTALARLAGRDDRPATICAQVLAVEQALTTRGGWQDQLGGLVPGVKLLSSLPTRPLRVRIEPVTLSAGVQEELQQRLVIVYTGISRLARDVLQRVVSGYLSRDALVVGGIQRLVECADHSRNLLSQGDFPALGAVFAEVWRLHQDLDPSSTPISFRGGITHCYD